MARTTNIYMSGRTIRNNTEHIQNASDEYVPRRAHRKKIRSQTDEELVFESKNVLDADHYHYKVESLIPETNRKYSERKSRVNERQIVKQPRIRPKGHQKRSAITLSSNNLAGIAEANRKQLRSRSRTDINNFNVRNGGSVRTTKKSTSTNENHVIHDHSCQLPVRKMFSSGSDRCVSTDTAREIESKHLAMLDEIEQEQAGCTSFPICNRKSGYFPASPPASALPQPHQLRCPLSSDITKNYQRGPMTSAVPFPKPCWISDISIHKTQPQSSSILPTPCDPYLQSHKLIECLKSKNNDYSTDNVHENQSSQPDTSQPDKNDRKIKGSKKYLEMFCQKKINERDSRGNEKGMDGLKNHRPVQPEDSSCTFCCQII